MVTCVAAVCGVISRGAGETHDDGAYVDNGSGARIEHAEVREVGAWGGRSWRPQSDARYAKGSTNEHKSSLGLG